MYRHIGLFGLTGDNELMEFRVLGHSDDVALSDFWWFWFLVINIMWVPEQFERGFTRIIPFCHLKIARELGQLSSDNRVYLCQSWQVGIIW